jgi:hypothetical protein
MVKPSTTAAFKNRILLAPSYVGKVIMRPFNLAKPRMRRRLSFDMCEPQLIVWNYTKKVMKSNLESDIWAYTGFPST